MKFTQLAKSLEEGLAPVYLLEGEEVYFRENAVKRIRAACGICNPVLNETRFEGEELKGEKFDEFLASLRALDRNERFFKMKKGIQKYMVFFQRMKYDKQK